MELFTQSQIKALSTFVDPDRFSTGQSNRELHIKDISPPPGETARRHQGAPARRAGDSHRRKGP